MSPESRDQPKAELFKHEQEIRGPGTLTITTSGGDVAHFELTEDGAVYPSIEKKPSGEINENTKRRWIAYARKRLTEDAHRDS